ncbi:hypothetical protein BKI52_32330 [marine bacterium AO1-C]|nr:hypothetical protein BKI52_32330 [marine bacterium AO1-C]
MGEVALKVEAIGKLYRLNHTVNSLAHTIQKLIKPSPKNHKKKLWVLKDISFELRKGEVLGILGHNGAGKSTLLKIFSRITTPTEGTLEIYGKVSSLLELGAGFHPELTGRENIFLNGSMLGMSRNEIKQKLDEIIDFSGLESFIHTPIKKYSSGMYLRLAFSVAAFLDSDILLLDEILAVGDSVFQQKCINKIFDLKKEEKTIVVVSHNLSVIQSLCTRAILLENGKIKTEGKPLEVINAYTQLNAQSFKQHITLDNYTRSSEQISELLFSSLYFNKSTYFPNDEFVIGFTLKPTIDKPFSDIYFGIDIYDVFHNNIYHLSNLFLNILDVVYEPDTIYEFCIPRLQLKPGLYKVDIYVNANDHIQDWILNQIIFHVDEGNIYQFNKSSMIKGVVQPNFSFKQKKSSS